MTSESASTLEELASRLAEAKISACVQGSLLMAT